MKEVLKEIFASIRIHKARSILTGFGVAWGMFILIILLGAGNGFRAGILNIFSGYASNSIWITGHRTSQANIIGIREDVNVRFSETTLSNLKKTFPQIKSIAEEVDATNMGDVHYMGNSGYFQIKGVGEDYINIRLLEIGEGSWLSKLDHNHRRRTVIIGHRVKDILFKDENPIGKSINISGAFFQVKGVLSDGSIFSAMDQNNLYIPSESLFETFNLSKEYTTFGILLYKDVLSDNFENDLKSFLSQKIGFSKDDKSAISVNNVQLQVKAFNSLFDGIDTFLWILGFCFLLSGIIGIANIMLVVVKERTNEIGIRKALGATPNSIIQMIIIESVIITVVFGFIGLLLGSVGLFCYNWIISALQTGQETVFEKGYVQIYVILAAFTMLVVAGIIAGIFPAKRAAELIPIQTLNKM